MADPVLTWPEHLKISWGGTLGTPNVEIWSNSMRYVTANLPPVASPAELQTIADLIADDIATWMESPSSIISPTAKLTYVKVVFILPNGKQRDVNTAQHDYATPVAGGSTTGYLPIWEQSYAQTLRSNLNRGRTHAGRIYPPMNGQGPAAGSPYAAAGDCLVMGQQTALLITSLNTHISSVIESGGPVGGISIVSPGNSIKGTDPLTSYVTKVVVDEVADIQHRRTNRVPRKEAATTTIPYIP